jgi:hypothetical protein
VRLSALKERFVQLVLAARRQHASETATTAKKEDTPPAPLPLLPSSSPSPASVPLVPATPVESPSPPPLSPLSLTETIPETPIAPSSSVSSLSSSAPPAPQPRAVSKRSAKSPVCEPHATRLAKKRREAECSSQQRAFDVLIGLVVQLYNSEEDEDTFME